MSFNCDICEEHKQYAGAEVCEGCVDNANSDYVAVRQAVALLQYLVDHTAKSGIASTTSALYSFNQVTMNLIKAAVAKAKEAGQCLS